MLFRRSPADLNDWQAFVAFAPQGCKLETLVAVTGRCRTFERAFEAAKQETGLDDYEVRSAVGWYRHVTLALWALSLLTVVQTAGIARPAPPKKETGTAKPGRLQAVARLGWRLSLSEIRHLLGHLVL